MSPQQQQQQQQQLMVSPQQQPQQQQQQQQQASGVATASGAPGTASSPMAAMNAMAMNPNTINMSAMNSMAMANNMGQVQGMNAMTMTNMNNVNGNFQQSMGHPMSSTAMPQVFHINKLSSIHQLINRCSHVDGYTLATTETFHLGLLSVTDIILKKFQN